MMIFHNFGWLAHPGNIEIFCWNTNLQIYIEYIKVHVLQCIFWSNIYSDKIWIRFGFRILIWWYSITLDDLRIKEISKYSVEIPIFKYIQYIKVHVFQCIFWSNIYSEIFWFRFGFSILIWWYSISLDDLRIEEISKYSVEIQIFKYIQYIKVHVFNVSFDPIYFPIKMIQIRIQNTHMMIFHNFGWLAHPGNIKIFCWNTNLQIYPIN